MLSVKITIAIDFIELSKAYFINFLPSIPLSSNNNKKANHYHHHVLSKDSSSVIAVT